MATQQAQQAAGSATAAAGYAGAAKWQAGTNYVDGAVVWSPISYYTYRARGAGVSGTDPASDPARWVLVSNAIAPTMLVLSERQPSGTGAGDGLQNGTVNRALNTVEINTISGAAMGAGGVITLPAGTYHVDATAAFYQLASARLRIWSDTAGAVICAGVNAGSGNGGLGFARLGECRFSLAAPAQIRLQMYMRTVNSTLTSTLGYPLGNGEPEIYARITIFKVG